MKSCLKTGERRFVRNRPISMMNAIEKNWLHSVQHFATCQTMKVHPKGLSLFPSLKTSIRLTDAEPYFCAVYNHDIIYKNILIIIKTKQKKF